MTVTVEAAEELPVDLTGGLELLGASGELFLDGGEGGFELFHPGSVGGRDAGCLIRGHVSEHLVTEQLTEPAAQGGDVGAEAVIGGVGVRQVGS